MKHDSKTLRFAGLAVLVCALGVAGPWETAARAVVIDRIIAVVNKDIITLSEVQQAGKNEISELRRRFNGQRLKREMEGVQRKYLDLLITRRLQIHRAQEMSLDLNDTEVDRALDEVKKRNGLSDDDLKGLLKREGLTVEEYRRRVGEEILIRRVMNIEVRSRVSVSPEEVRVYYKSHQSKYMPPERIRASHILFLAPVNATPEVERAKRAAADNVRRKIRGGADFAEMAKGHSQDPSAAKGGDLGVIRRGEVLPNFERVLFAMKDGEVSDVVRTRAGFHIIKLIRRLPRKAKPFQKVESEIRNQIFQEKANGRFTRWMEDLKKKAYIEVTM